MSGTMTMWRTNIWFYMQESGVEAIYGAPSPEADKNVNGKSKRREVLLLKE